MMEVLNPLGVAMTAPWIFSSRNFPTCSLELKFVDEFITFKNFNMIDIIIS